MSVFNIKSYYFQRMNTRRNIGHWRKGGAAGGNQVPPKAPTKGVPMSVNLTRLSDAEIQASLAQTAQSITMQAQAMNAQVNRQDV